MTPIKISPPTSFGELHQDLWDRLVSLALDQMAADWLRPADSGARKRNHQTAVDLRESLEYRFSAVGLHVGLLRQHQARAVQELEANPLQALRGGSWDTAYTARRQQQILFDSVIFNSIALFDYLGNAIGFSFYGTDSGAWKWTWKGATQYARNPKSESAKYRSRLVDGRRYAGSEVANVVTAVDAGWLNRLIEYRAELIHYTTEPAGGKSSFLFEGNPGPLQFQVTITAPPAFSKLVRMPGKEKGEEVPIVEAADWLIRQTHDSAVHIVESLRNILGRKSDGPDGKRLIHMP